MGEPPADRVQELFDQAVALPPAQRAAFLETACAGDADLRALVESLLACDADFAAGTPEGLLKSPLVRLPEPTTAGADGPGPEALPPGLPARVGHYRILRRIAEGGMGVVYEAEQDSPRRVVALKVVRPGLASPAVLRRFTHEAQILGRLHHPGIAQVYEAGLAENGQPFFAMEFIHGVALDEYARLRSLTLPARLELVVRVCDAVQHAHDQGIIHRDLKPANILVEETGQPKVLDFGVARATGADLLTGAGLTQTGQLLGTPSYMSPEQVTADPAAIDHRADVYALGVVLFELLAGRLPYQLENRALAEAARLILEQEPPRLGSLNPELRGDVETVVAKALEKDPARRYPSAADLAADLRRWLAQEPILARPPSALYQLRKFARRHKGLVGGVFAVMAALVLGLIGTILFAVDARQNARRATENEKDARSQAYQARLAAAVAALSGHDVADAARHLEHAPPELRGWEWRHLQSRLDDSTAMLPLRPGDPALLLPGPLTLPSPPSAGEGGRVRVGLRVGIFTDTGLRITDESGTASPERPFPSLANQVLQFSVQTAADGWWLAAAENHRLVTLRDETGRVVRTIESPGEIANAPLALSPDRTRVAVPLVDENGHISFGVYDTTSGKELVRWATDVRLGLYALVFSQDGTRLAACGENLVIPIWDATTGRLLAKCQGHTAKVMSLAFRGDGARLLTAAHDGTVRQWDAHTGHEVEPPYDRHTAEVFAAVYSADGQRIASAGADRTVRLWRASGRQDQAVLHGHTGAVAALAFAPDGRRLASASYDAIFARGDRTVRFWEAVPEVRLPVLAGHTNYVYPVAYSPDGRWIASGGWDHAVRLWDAATGEACATLPHPGVVWALAFSPDGTGLYSGGNFKEGVLLLWDVATGQVRGRVRGVGQSIRTIAISPDGARIAVGNWTAGAGFTMSVWDVATGQNVGADTGLPFAFSPDGKWLAGRDAEDKNVVLWDARTFRPVVHCPGHTGVIHAIAFHPDGRHFVSASSDRTVRLWDAATGRCVRIFEGHTDEVFAAAFHPSGTRLATGGRDRAVWIWDPDSGREVARLPGHTSYVWSLAFNPDGTALASGSGDATVRLWDTAPLRVRYWARRAAEALRPEAERLVERLFQSKKDATEVVAALRADQSLGEPQRNAALRAALHRSAQRAEAKPRGN